MSTIFDVKEMTCGNCVKHVTKAVQAAQPGAEVNADLATGKVDSYARAKRPRRPRQGDHRRGLSGATRAIAANGETAACHCGADLLDAEPPALREAPLRSWRNW